ncbi:MAG: HipA domain-containing protein [Proteobacteria bacterium]|nr:HipA domain-containing protein [Pseudomonadota bacterium]
MVVAAPSRRQVQVCIGKAGLPLGALVYLKQGRRENCAFAYDEAWLANPARFNVSADLQLVPGYQPHKAASVHDSVGMRPKCTLVDEDGRLAIGKFPSVADTRSVTRGEVLALKLAALAGVDAAQARIVVLGDVPVAVIRRFDRDAADGRIPYQSAASLLQASREEDRSYTEIADAIRSHGHAPTDDLRQLWRRLVLNLLITNVDDHLQNHGFLHVEHGLWRLAPAFDINPFPDKDGESKTWLSEQDGPITDVQMLLARAAYFALDKNQALAVLGEVHAAVSNWRQVALGPEVGLRAAELHDFAAAFEHEHGAAVAALLGL